MTIGENLTYWRKKSGMTQRKLAETVMVSYGMIALIEQNKKNPSIDLAERLAEACGCTRDDILLEGAREA